MNEEQEKYGGLYTQWNSVTDQIYVVHFNFVERMSAVNAFSNTVYEKRVELEKLGATRDLYKLYRLCIPAKAFPASATKEDLLKMKELCTNTKLKPKVEDLNWAADKVTEWFSETGFLSVSVPRQKKFGKKNAMAEWYGNSY